MRPRMLLKCNMAPVFMYAWGFLVKKMRCRKWTWMGNKVRSPCSAVTCVSVKSVFVPTNPGNFVVFAVARTERYRFHCQWRYIDGRHTHGVTFRNVMDNYVGAKQPNNPVQSQRKCRCTESTNRRGLYETGDMLCGNTLDPVDNDREPTYTNIGIIYCVEFA